MRERKCRVCNKEFNFSYGCGEYSYWEEYLCGEVCWAKEKEIQLQKSKELLSKLSTEDIKTIYEITLREMDYDEEFLLEAAEEILKNLGELPEE